MRFPWAQTDPAEVRLAGLVLADHVVAAPVLLDDGVAGGTLLGVGRDPVARLAVVVTLPDPFLDQVTSDRIVPVLSTTEAEGVTALTLDWTCLHVLKILKLIKKLI